MEDFGFDLALHDNDYPVYADHDTPSLAPLADDDDELIYPEIDHDDDLWFYDDDH